MRADCFGITNGEWSGRTTNNNSTGWFKYNLNNYDWSSDEVFRNNLDGATVVMTIKRIGSELYLIEDVTTADESPKSFRHYFVMDCATDKDNNLKARLTVDRAHLIINNTAPVTDSQTLPTITGTLQGLIDQKGVFGWGAHEDFTLSANSTLELNFINYSSKGENWFNWILEIQDGSNYLDLRCDNYGWGTYWNNKTSCTQTSGYWDNFQDKMDGATVNMTIERSGANLTVTAVHTPKTGDAFTQTFTNESFPAEGDVVVRLLTDNACLDLRSVAATIGSTGWTTFASPCALNLSGMTASTGSVTAYYASAIGDDKVKMTSTESTGVAAGEGLMLKGTVGATITIPVVGSGSAIAGNKLVGCTSSTSLTANDDYYVLVNNGGIAEFQSLATNGATIPAGKAYLNASAGARLSIVFEDEGVTAIKAIDAFDNSNAQADGKRLENGKIVIVKNGVKFNTNGQKIK